jgi:hypothetical protein
MVLTGGIFYNLKAKKFMIFKIFFIFQPNLLEALYWINQKMRWEPNPQLVQKFQEVTKKTKILGEIVLLSDALDYIFYFVENRKSQKIYFQLLHRCVSQGNRFQDDERFYNGILKMIFNLNTNVDGLSSIFSLYFLEHKPNYLNELISKIQNSNLENNELKNIIVLMGTIINTIFEKYDYKDFPEFFEFVNPFLLKHFLDSEELEGFIAGIFDGSLLKKDKELKSKVIEVLFKMKFRTKNALSLLSSTIEDDPSLVLMHIHDGVINQLINVLKLKDTEDNEDLKLNAILCILNLFEISPNALEDVLEEFASFF